MRWSLGGLLALTALSLAAVLPALAEDQAPDQSRIYLSWHAPWGAPGATADLVQAPGDTTREDTLYLSCDPAYDSKTFNGFTADLYFRAAPGDTLGPYWRFGRGMNELRHVRPVFEPDTAFRYPVPWRSGGFGAISYDWSRGVGHLQVVYAVPPQRTGSSRYGTRYTFARLLFQRPSRDEERGPQPLCIEWAKGTMAIMYGYEPTVSRGERFATVNSPDGAACSESRRTVVPKVWTPKR